MRRLPLLLPKITKIKRLYVPLLRPSVGGRRGYLSVLLLAFASIISTAHRSNAHAGETECPSDCPACLLRIISTVSLDAPDTLAEHQAELEKLMRVRLFYELPEMEHSYDRRPPKDAAAKHHGALECTALTANNRVAAALHLSCTLKGLGEYEQDRTYTASSLSLSLGTQERLKLLAQDALRTAIAVITEQYRQDRLEASVPHPLSADD